ncbi:MAG TPA: BrnT family toxin [Terracidiphilus sp.]|nr:BrnT family toxin [Terracidiphilus sp.]
MDNVNFDWDGANIGHIAEHDVKPDEAEEVLLGDPLDFAFQPEEGSEERWAYLGETNTGRILQVVITLRSEKIRVVTAYDASKHEKRLYLETKLGKYGQSEGS